MFKVELEGKNQKKDVGKASSGILGASSITYFSERSPQSETGEMKGETSSEVQRFIFGQVTKRAWIAEPANKIENWTETAIHKRTKPQVNIVWK